MSLDQNLFTLLFSPSKDDPNVTDLVDPLDNPHYRKLRVPGSVYKIDVYDPLSQSLLATATAPSATSKVKIIELHNPSHTVELKFAGTLNFKWRFKWEEHEFEWKREECFIIRKPDPAVLVAVTKEAAGRIRTSSVQILDYNIHRFDIQDRKGLEILILTALLTFQDTSDAYHTPPGEAAMQDVSSTSTSMMPSLGGLFGSTRRPSETGASPSAQHAVPAEGVPMLPPKPAPKTGVDRVSEMHTVRAAQGEGVINEILVGEEGTVEDYAEYAERLLKDEAMLFVTVRSAAQTQVPKVLQVVEQTKRLRYLAGLDEDEELHQYVVYDTAKPKGRKIINLNDRSSNSHQSYAPPTSLSVHLSKIDMPELKPRATQSTHKSLRIPSNSGSTESPVPEPPKSKSKSKSKEDAKAEAARLKELEKEKERQKEKEKKAAKKEHKKHGSSSIPPPTATPPAPNKLTKPSSQTPPSGRPNAGFPSRLSMPSFQPVPASTPFSYQAPSPASAGSYAPPVSSFYSGMSFPTPTRPPPGPTQAGPPQHPSTQPRPGSFYGSGFGTYGHGSHYVRP